LEQMLQERGGMQQPPEFYDQKYEDVEEFLGNIKAFKDELRGKVRELGALVEHRERPSGELLRGKCSVAEGTRRWGR
jgi:hypothetical protein